MRYNFFGLISPKFFHFCFLREKNTIKIKALSRDGSLRITFGDSEKWGAN